jgi:hypothetical protein
MEIDPMRRLWRPAERRRVLERYSLDGPAKLAAELERSVDSISSLAGRYGQRSLRSRERQAASRSRSSPSLNTRFFDEPSRHGAFVLGVIWACGSIKTKYGKVLRLVVPADRRAVLLRVLELMNSKHQIQTYDERRVLEICNAHLVSNFLDRFGHPPASSANPDLPWIAWELVPMFAWGHLQATGSRDDSHFRWSGHKDVMVWLSDEIRRQTKAGPPEEDRFGGRLTIRWRAQSDLAGIGRWLGETL